MNCANTVAFDLSGRLGAATATAIPRPPDLTASFVVPGNFGVGDAARPMPGTRHRTPVPQMLRSPKLPGGVHVGMTLLETAGLLHLLCDPTLVQVVPRAHVLSYLDGDTWRRFTPDAVAVRRDGGIVVHAFRYSWERDPEMERELARAYRRHGIGLTVTRDTRLLAGRDNRHAMLRDHVDPGRQGDVAKVRSALDHLGLPTTVEKARRRARFPAKGGADRALRCLHVLTLSGEVSLDLDRPFGGDTRIRRGPLS